MAHCISADYALGAGIAKDVECRYSVRNQLKRLNRRLCPDCIAVGNILNIVTKPRYWDKPTYESFTKALIYTKEVCKKLGINHIVMPKIGCGLDGCSAVLNKVQKYKDYLYFSIFSIDF